MDKVAASWVDTKAQLLASNLLPVTVLQEALLFPAKQRLD